MAAACVCTETYYPAGSLKRQLWRQAGQLHRESDLPACIKYREGGLLRSEAWYLHGQLHRDHDLPARIYYNEDGSTFIASWYAYGQQTREHDLPTEVAYHEDGRSVFRQSWEQRANDLPSRVILHRNGALHTQTWLTHAEPHRDYDLPAIIIYRKNGTVNGQLWYQHGQLHRVTEHDDPAWIRWNADDICISKWYIHNKLQKTVIVHPEPPFEDLVKGSADQQVVLYLELSLKDFSKPGGTAAIPQETQIVSTEE